MFVTLSTIFSTFQDFGKTVMDFLFGSMGDVLPDWLTSTLNFIGIPVETPMIVILLGSGVTIWLVYSLIKWLVGILTD